MRGPTQCQPVKLTDEHTLHDTMTIARQQFPLTATGYVCQTDDLWRILLAAAARHTTIEAICADLLGAPDTNTVRGYLAAQLLPQTISDLEQRWNDTLAALVPEWLGARPQEIALDFHDEPYYGRADPDDPNNWVCGGEARGGDKDQVSVCRQRVLLHPSPAVGGGAGPARHYRHAHSWETGRYARFVSGTDQLCHHPH